MFLDHCQKNLYDPRIELFARLFSQIINCFLTRPCAAVRLSRIERIPDIDHCYQPREQGNFLAF